MKKLLLLPFALVVLSLTSNKSISKHDNEFMMEAATGGLIEVKLSELAMTNGSSASVKMLGEHMVKDHSRANDELKALALKKGVNLPANITDDQQKKYRELFEKKGRDFDEAYSKHMVKDHKKDISLFKKEAKKGEDQDIKSWAAATIPVLEGHLQMSEEACKAVKYEK